VPKSIPGEAERRRMFYLDATCPLVSKVHREAEHHHARGRHIFMIGHAGHPEVIGTMGQLPEGSITLVEDENDARKVIPPEGASLAFITQTTLSVDDTAEVIGILQGRFPEIASPAKEDICYATTNRQAAVKEIAPRADLMIVVGAPNSSNSLRLVEVSERLGTPAKLIQRASEIDFAWLDGVETLGLTAGASAPEILVREVVAALAQRRTIREREITATVEKMVFKLPRQLTE
jgi:4-hydroxy-3-methylbut-2-enyl diphosphate reductase